MRSLKSAGNVAPTFAARKTFGFTLAELLMAILVMSIIMTALAPMITRRVADNVKVNIAKKDGQLFLYDIYDPNCKAATDGTTAVDCTFEAPSSTNLVNVILVSGGGGGSGSTTPTTLYNQKKTVAHGTPGNSTSADVVITSGMKNVVISYLTGGGGGGGGGAYASTNGGAPQSQADCTPHNAMFVRAALNGASGKNLCVTKYNVGDANGPSIPSSVVTVATGQNCSGNKCCWSGTSSSNCTASGSWSGHSSNYSGCNRTVCTWYAANDACLTWAPTGTNAGDWRLPTSVEMSGWQANISAVSTYLGSDGMQLCDNGSSSYGSVQCDCRSSGCPGSYNNYCYPSNVWSSSPNGSSYYNYSLNNGTFYQNGSNPRNAFSAAVSWRKGLSALALLAPAEAAALLT